MRTEEVKERLRLKDLSETNERGERRERIFYVQPSIATTSDGLFEGLVSTGLSDGQGQSFDNGPGLAIRKYQGAPTTTGQINASGPQLRRTPFRRAKTSTCTTPFLQDTPDFAFSYPWLVFLHLSASEICNCNTNIGLFADFQHSMVQSNPKVGLVERAFELP